MFQDVMDEIDLEMELMNDIHLPADIYLPPLQNDTNLHGKVQIPPPVRIHVTKTIEQMLIVSNQTSTNSQRVRCELVQELIAHQKSHVHSCISSSSSSSSMGGDSNNSIPFVMDEIISKSLDLIKQTQQSEFIWSRLLEGLSREESDYVAKAREEIFQQRMQYPHEKEKVIEILDTFFKEVFQLDSSGGRRSRGNSGSSSSINPNDFLGKQNEHSLGLILVEFCTVFHTVYKPLLSNILLVPTRQILPMIARDFIVFAHILIQVCRHKYDTFDSMASLQGIIWQDLVHELIVQALFVHGQPTLHGLYALCLQQEDQQLEQFALRMSSQPMEAFGIKPLFYLVDTIVHPPTLPTVLLHYQSCTGLIQSLPFVQSPWKKLDILAQVCRQIDQTIKKFYHSKSNLTNGPSEEELNVTGDDLCGLLMLLVVATVCPLRSHLATQIVLMGSYMPEKELTNEKGFALATLQSSIQRLCRLRTVHYR